MLGTETQMSQARVTKMWSNKHIDDFTGIEFISQKVL